MSNSADFELWVNSTYSNVYITPVGSYATNVVQTLQNVGTNPHISPMQTEMDAFKIYLTNYASCHSPVFLYMRNSGVGQFSYYTLGDEAQVGMQITIDDSKPAPGVCLKRNFWHNILDSVFCALKNLFVLKK